MRRPLVNCRRMGSLIGSFTLSSPLRHPGALAGGEHPVLGHVEALVHRPWRRRSSWWHPHPSKPSSPCARRCRASIWASSFRISASKRRCPSIRAFRQGISWSCGFISSPFPFSWRTDAAFRGRGAPPSGRQPVFYGLQALLDRVQALGQRRGGSAAGPWSQQYGDRSRGRGAPPPRWR